MTILEAAAQLRARQVSSRELTVQCLKRALRANQKLNAFMALMEEHALERAALADDELARGIDRGPFHGIPVAYKDLFYTRGVRTTAGSKVFANFVPAFDGAVVEKLDAAGAVNLGKLGMHELAYGVTSNNPHYGPVRNPWNTERIPGGSSGGSGAAVAAGLAFMAMGSDTGGSIRIPAAYCGTVGIKATFGRVSRFGCLPLSYDLDHVGPLNASVRDAAITLNAIGGHDPRDANSSRAPMTDFLPPAGVSIAGLRIGLPENFYFERVEPPVREAVQRAARHAETLGAHVVPLRVPDPAALTALGRVILLAEASALYERHWNNRHLFGPDVLTLIDQGRFIRATDYLQAQRVRRILQQEWDTLWNTVDCLFTPTTPVTAPPIGANSLTIEGVEDDVRLSATRLVRGINVLGLPALAMPLGLAPDGLPMSLHIIGPAWQEDRILRVGAALEDTTDWHHARPPEV